MNRMKTVSGWVSVLALTLATASVQAQDRKHTYACEVQTMSGIAGLVVVQADTQADAKSAASAASAHTLAGERSPAMSVVQCIEPAAGERFRDSGFQRFYEDFPR